MFNCNTLNEPRTQSLFNESPSTSCGVSPYELLIRKVLEAPKTKKVLIIAHGCLPELLLNTSQTEVELHRKIKCANFFTASQPSRSWDTVYK